MDGVVLVNEIVGIINKSKKFLKKDYMFGIFGFNDNWLTEICDCAFYSILFELVNRSPTK